MTIYKIENETLTQVQRTTFGDAGVFERQHLQAMLRDQIEIVSPDTMVVAEEFGEWEESKRRIDLLGIRTDGSLVVIELKRTEDGGHMELQALRYAAMISTLTFSKLVTIYKQYLDKRCIEADAREQLLNFLELDEPDEDNFAQEVKIVLASAEFSKELTTSVIWLNDFGLDIKCVRMHPYENGDQLLLDIQTVIPVPETADYQIKIREKKQQERAARSQSRDTTKFDLTVNGKTYTSLKKRWLVHTVVSELVTSGVSPIEIANHVKAMPGGRSRLFEVFDGEHSEIELKELIMADDSGGKLPRTARYFCNAGEFYLHEGKTYTLSNQWGTGTLETIKLFADTYPNFNLTFDAVYS
ncbi:MAG: hypothetical protein ACSHWP_01525 [Pseudoalteromonas sp.]|jgi:hypothetical protein